MRALPLASLMLVLAVVARADIELTAANAVVTAPMTLENGVLHQPIRTELSAGGTAVFLVTIPDAGDYTVTAVVDAPDGYRNSLYIAFDEPAADRGALTEFTVTDGFESRPVNWRGRGDLDDPEFAPKVFTLSAGEHRLIVTGREPIRLRSLTIQRHQPPAPGSADFYRLAYRNLEWTSRQAQRELYARGRPDNVEIKGLSEQRMRQHADLYAQALAHVRQQTGPAAALEILTWVVGSITSHYSEAGPDAVALLAHGHAADPAVGAAVGELVHFLPWPGHPMELGTKSLFQAVAANNPDPAARGQARFGLALFAKRDFEIVEARGSAETADESHRRAIAAFEEVRRDYGDRPVLRENGPRKITLRERADQELAELRSLRIGMPAPDIAGSDLDGTAFRLSDYRGKVVLLVFWASWCGPCMAAVPAEKALAEKYRDRPFVLLGVNGDGDTASARKAVMKNEIPWRSFWNGGDERISRAWNVRGWPTVYLIDHAGIIRERVFVKHESVEPLVAAAETAARR